MSDNYDKQKARKQFITGLSMTGAFGFLLVVMGMRWAIFPMVFAGIIPLIKGIASWGDWKSGELPGTSRRISKKNAERAILACAYQNKGKVSATLIAMKTGLTLEDSEKYLGELAGKGHASMNIRDNGSIEYVFNDLVPDDRTDDPYELL